jgi:hypothetical protein
MTITYPSSGELKQIACKNPNEDHRALGWMMMTDGKSTSQFITSKEKAKRFAGSILQIRMQRQHTTFTISQVLAIRS